MANQYAQFPSLNIIDATPDEQLAIFATFKSSIDALPNALEGVFSKGCALYDLDTGKQYKNFGTVDQPDFKELGGGLETIRVEITPSEILAMGTTPVELIPAQGVGTIIDVISVAGTIVYGGVQYGTHTNVEILEGGNALWANSNLLPATGNFNRSFNQNGGATLASNTPLTATTTGGNPTGGNGTLIIYVTYKVFPV